MAQEQKYAIGIKGNEKPDCFFFDHSFKTAYQHALAFLKRNKGKRDYVLYRRNDGIGERWIPISFD